MATRKPHLRQLLLIPAIASALVLAACSGTSSAPESEEETGTETSSEQEFGALEVPLSWQKTWEFAGLYFAEDLGYFEEEGFSSVNLIAGGPSATPSATQLVTGGNLVAMSNPIDIASLIEAEGSENAPIKIIGSTFQTNAYAVFALAESGITKPEDLVGKTVGVAPNNERVWKAFLAANDIDESTINVVAIQGAADGLITGEYDASIGFGTNQAAAIELQGYDVEVLMLADHGLPFVAGSIATTEENIANHREALKAFLVAAIRGWQDALLDPEEGVRLTVEVAAADQDIDPAHQLLTAERQIPLMTSAWTVEHGLFSTSEDAIKDTVAAVQAVGFNLPSDIFDMSLLEEVYAENPDLIKY